MIRIVKHETNKLTGSYGNIRSNKIKIIDIRCNYSDVFKAFRFRLRVNVRFLRAAVRQRKNLRVGKLFRHIESQRAPATATIKNCLTIKTLFELC